MKKLSFYYPAFAFGLAMMLFACQSPDGKEKQDKVFLPLVKLEQAERKFFAHFVKVQGNVETDKDVILNAESGGEVTRIFVREGQRVSAGQILVTLDASVLASNLQELRTQLNHAEYMLGKQEELRKRGVGSEFDYENAKSQVDALEARIQSLNTQRGKSFIRAPFAGVIDRIYAKEGQIILPQISVLRLVNNEQIDITADISEKYLSSLTVGTPIEVRFPNFSDTVLRLQINHIGSYIEPTNRTFQIAAQVSNNKDFLPNMLAELSIRDESEENALVIPARSIIKDQNNNDFVYKAKKVGKDNRFSLEKVVVRTKSKYQGEASIEVLEGKLIARDKIVTEGAKGVTEKDTVRVK